MATSAPPSVSTWILDPDPVNLARAMQAFRDRGYSPCVPVDLDDFVDSENRLRWRRDKDMVVFTVLRTDGSRGSEVDWFLEPPFPFGPAYAEAFYQELPGGGPIPFVDLQRLLRMKADAGRDKDLTDLAVLRKLIHDD